MASPPVNDNTVQTLVTSLEVANQLCDEAIRDPEKINASDQFNNTVLHLSILLKRGDVFEKLIENKSLELNTKNIFNRTPIIDAVRLEEHHLVSKLLSLGADVDIQDGDGNTALHYAALLSFGSFCYLLLEHGADPDVQNKIGETPFHWAVDNDLPEIKTMMMCYGADPHVIGNNGLTPFGIVISKVPFSEFHEEFYMYSYDEELGSDVALSDLAVAMVVSKKIFLKLLGVESRIVCTEATIEFFSETVSCMPIENVDLLFAFMPKVNYVLADYCGFSIFNLYVTEMSMYRSRSSADVLKIITVFLHDKLVKYLLNSPYYQGAVIKVLAVAFHEMKLPEKLLTQLVMKLLVFGVKVREVDMQTIYELYGFSELFAMLLHMKIPAPYRYPSLGNTPIMPTLIYNPKMSLKICKLFPKSYTMNRQLPFYFAMPKAMEALEEDAKEHKKVAKAEEEIPKVKFPSLLQLGRDAFREHFIDELRIENGAQFFNKLNQLDISNTYKNIISLNAYLSLKNIFFL